MPLIAFTARICTLYGDFSGRSDSRLGVSDRQSFPTRKTFAPFGAEAGGDGVGSGPDYLAV